MGQRLNVEIWNGGKALANAYYHWSAYTKSAAQTANSALDYIRNNPIPDGNILLYAIRVLEATGAGLTPDQNEYAKKLPELGGATFAERRSRIHGLIGISENAMKETRCWQEGSVFIYIDEKRVSFCVFSKQRRWDWEKEQREEYENINANASLLDVIKLNFDDIKFDDWPSFKEFLVNRESPFSTEFDRFTVVTPIY